MNAIRRAPSGLARGQYGLARIEAITLLVVILIGVLAIVGLHSRTGEARAESTLRAQAARHAAELVAELWTTPASARAPAFGSAHQGPRYRQWAARLQRGPVALPGSVEHPPVVDIRHPPASGEANRRTVTELTVTIYWQRRGMAVHQHVTTVRIPDPVTG